MGPEPTYMQMDTSAPILGILPSEKTCKESQIKILWLMWITKITLFYKAILVMLNNFVFNYSMIPSKSTS